MQVASVTTAVDGVPLPDFQLAVSLDLSHFQSGLASLIDELLPVGSIDLGSYISLSNEFSLQSIALDQFSLLQIARGVLPRVTLSVRVHGTTHTLSARLSLPELVGNAQAIINAVGVRMLLPQCIIDANCSGSKRCDHRSWPWSCTSSCPFPCGSLPVPLLGCFDGVPCPSLPDLPDLPSLPFAAGVEVATV